MASGGHGGSGGSWLDRLLAMPNDRPLKAVVVTLIVCLIGSTLVAGSAVLLRPAQIANQARERQARIAEIIARHPDFAGLSPTDPSIAMQAKAVDLASGNYLGAIDPGRFDQRRAAKDPEQSIAIPAARDLAKIKRRARVAVVYLVRREGQLKLVILPVHGRGFGSMLYGYLGLAADTETVVGLSFHAHGETPGLGALIDAPAWRDKWRGKRVWDDLGKPGLGVAKGMVAPGSPEAAYLVDGLTGATWTSRGVTDLLRFWLGDDGFGPYLRTIRDKRG